jgi:RES domain-containing protein
VKVYRIAKMKFVNDLSGKGAELYGGRWNNAGVPMIYTSESRALAGLEYLVHISTSLLPLNLSIAELEFSNRIKVDTIHKIDLPGNWKEYPAPFELPEIGSKWIMECTSLVLRVPSVLLENEFNYLINPKHRDISKIIIKNIESYSFDNRLIKTK